jgi:CheY-like chemotaxis protein
MFLKMEKNKMCKVLIVEDDPISMYLYREVLEKVGRHEVVMSTTGNELSEMIKEERPNLVILDVRLPIKSGFELYDEIKSVKDKSLSRIPVMFISASYSSAYISKMTGVSMDRCIMKPFDFRQLLSQIESIAKPKHKEILANGA